MGVELASGGTSNTSINKLLICGAKVMKRNKTIFSLLVAAALSLPFAVYASGTHVPGSSDEARVAAQQVQNQSTPATHEEIGGASRPSSTDAARALAGRQQNEARPVAMPSTCAEAGALRAQGSTDEARAAVGQCLHQA
jgi:hypothetical protein